MIPWTDAERLERARQRLSEALELPPESVVAIDIPTLMMFSKSRIKTLQKELEDGKHKERSH